MWTCVVDDNIKTLNFCLLEVQCFMFASAMTTIILAETVNALNLSYENNICLLTEVNRSQSNTNHPFTAMSDQERISPNNINTKSSKLVMRIKKNVNRGL